ncbi:flavin-containing monooxygenase [Myceligenerans pegani]|uniref:NAD(P)/FAD-dependent oxidoreductase n=1 Tax=Myceligenerans pegani TaxID=2776917 RepID=A0ABR9MVS9_9MICO|nr:NAD(P)/FAD-dependent oxidoreductase [Myceligenerans sp. TRM 65318]MBE1875493.1 NAD(P)/FAD-dependent oxidoreductase [Myceligenerans sp. TRM 65318]MBE3017764.1 NAD(P)/FAD-dependent oxidoreductase [Myceligenerans sp. TRM 65318]
MASTVHVIGAGPAGLAAAAALRARGVDATILEKSGHVGNAWRNHYDRLHLHTTRGLSRLPGLAIPREFGRWVARDDVVRYLEAYAAHHDLRVELEAEVTRIDREDGAWAVACADGTRTTDAVVVATGYNHTPHLPDWPGSDGFRGEIVHASRYRNPAPYAGLDVLVAGVGNTGAEIAQDLAEGGAASVRLAVRTPPHLVPRNKGLWAAQYTGLLVRHLPTSLVDALSVPVRKASFPDLSHLGLPIPAVGLATRVAQGAIPVQDVGLVAAVQAGTVRVVGPIDRFDGDEVVLADGARLAPDVVLAATGYRRALEPLVGHLGVLGEQGTPVVTHGRPAAPGLYFTGFTNPITGMFRETAADARRIARSIARGR